MLSIGIFLLLVAVLASIVSGFTLGPRIIICPNTNCNYKGPAKRKSRGSIVVGLILCCFFILPGLIYFMLKSGYRYSCPNCGMQISVDN